MIVTSILDYFYSKPIFCDFQKKKVLDQNGPYINTFQKNLGNVCLSVILDFCQSSIVCCFSSSVFSLLRPGNLLKVSYIILVVSKEAGFLISNTVFVTENTAHCLKNTFYKNEQICV